MKSTPTITTLIVTYRRPQLLKKAIESVLNQTYPHFELFICDNASGDETEAVVTEYCSRDARVKYHCHATNIGMIENYKFGLASVQTDFFSLLSDDDVLLPWFYETALSSLLRTPDAIFFASSTIVMTSKGKVIRIPLSLWEKEGIFYPPDGMLEMIGKYPVPTGIVFRKKILNHVSIDEENHLTWDCDYLLNSARQFPIIISKKPCAIFLQHSKSYSFSQTTALWENTFYRIIDRLEKNFDLPPPVAKEAKNKVLLDLFHWHLQHKNFEQASKIANILSDWIHHHTRTALSFRIFPFRSIIMLIFDFLREIKHKILIEKKYQKYYKYLK